jgi:hypothetical protein
MIVTCRLDRLCEPSHVKYQLTPIVDHLSQVSELVNAQQIRALSARQTAGYLEGWIASNDIEFLTLIRIPLYE